MTIQRRTICDDVCTVAFVQSYVTVLKFSLQPTLLSIVLLTLCYSTACLCRMISLLANEPVGSSLDRRTGTATYDMVKVKCYSNELVLSFGEQYMT